MGIKPFYFYHFIFFISVGILLAYQSHTTVSLILAIGYSIIAFIVVSSQLNKDITFELPWTNMGLYLILQWILLLVILIAELSLALNGIIAIGLLLLYVFFMQVSLTMHRNQISLQSIHDELNQFDDTLLSVRAQRHDFLKHVNTLHYLLGETDDGRAASYLKDLIEDYDLVNEALKGEVSHVASVLLQHTKRAKTENIEVKYRFGLAASKLPLQPTDQVNVLANLLENAIDAASEATVEPKEIVLSTSVYGGIYRLEITNSTTPIPNYILDHLFVKFNLTTKQGTHEGLGTYIIKEIVNRYQGQIDYIYEKKKMKITVTLPNVKSN